MAMNRFKRLLSFFSSFSIFASLPADSADDFRLILSEDIAMLLLEISARLALAACPGLSLVSVNNSLKIPYISVLLK